MSSVFEVTFYLLVGWLSLVQALYTSNLVTPRVLKAASLEHDVTKRGLSISLRNNIQLHYVDDNISDGQTPMAARVHLSSRYPTIMLEEIESLVKDIHCEPNSISIGFAPDQFTSARRTLDRYDNFLLITSHHGCNERGSRRSYFISNKTYDQVTSRLELSVRPVTWKSAYHFKVDIGESTEKYLIHLHDHLRRNIVNEKEGDIDPSPAVSSVSTLQPSAKISFSIPHPDSTPTSTTINQAVSTSYLDTKILPPDSAQAVINGLSIGGISVPEGVSVRCTNCTTYGSIKLVSGSFSSRGSNNSTEGNAFSDFADDFNDAVDFIQDGFIQVAANGLGAHIELETVWAASLPQEFEITLATIPLQPYSIPDIAVIGPIFSPKLVIGAAVSADINFKSGFSVSVPDNSTATVNIGNVTESSLTGFDRTTFNSLPFSSSMENIALNLSLSLKPELLLGVSFFMNVGEAGAGIFLEMPKLSLMVQPVSVAVNEKCEPIADKAAANNILSLLNTNLTHFVPAVEFAGGFVAEASLEVGNLPNLRKQTAWTPLATSFPGPTACLAFDRKQSGYVVASTALAALASATSKGAASSLHTPFSMAHVGGLGIQGIVILLGFVFGTLVVM